MPIRICEQGAVQEPLMQTLVMESDCWPLFSHQEVWGRHAFGCGEVYKQHGKGVAQKLQYLEALVFTIARLCIM
jgi:hypothetical protein